MTIVLTDTFARTQAGSLGTASDSHVWTEKQAGDNMSVGSSEGQATFATSPANRSLETLGTPGITDGEIVFRTSTSLVTTSSDIYALCRYTDTSNYYWLGLQWVSSGVYNAAIRKRVSGTNTTITSTSFSVSAATFYWIKARVQGSNLFLKIWADGSSEPDPWTLTTTDSALTTGTLWGLAPFATNTSVIKFDHFTLQDMAAVNGAAGLGGSGGSGAAGAYSTQGIALAGAGGSAVSLAKLKAPALALGGLGGVAALGAYGARAVLAGAGGLANTALRLIASAHLGGLGGLIVNVPIVPATLPGASELEAARLDFINALCDKTCTIQRGSGSRVDDGYGHTITPLANVATQIPCNLARPTGGLFRDIAARLANLNTWDVSVPLGTDIRPGDVLSVSGHVLTVHSLGDPESFPILLHVLCAETT